MCGANPPPVDNAHRRLGWANAEVMFFAYWGKIDYRVVGPNSRKCRFFGACSSMHLTHVVDVLSGMFQYYRSPRKRDGWGGPLNNQQLRQAIFKELLEHFQFSAIVETGTYRGTTTDFFHKVSALPVYTVEIQPRFYGFSAMRFWHDRDVVVRLNDSRAFLGELAAEPTFRGQQLFFYLDAHWESDLPLAEEIDIIFRHWPDAVIMIDDFQVPFDDGYQYDDYGEDASLTPAYLDRKLDLPVERFFPSASSEAETGAKRGSIVLSYSAATTDRLKTLTTLRQVD